MSDLWGREDLREYPYFFWILYSLIYMTQAIYGTFIPVYLKSINFSQSAIGNLLALGPLVAVFASPIWGIAADRATYKNIVLKILVLGSAVSIIFFPLSNSFVYVLIAISVFTFFQSSIFPLSDAITLEYLEGSGWKYGPIRMAGTLGFAVMALAAGVIASQNVRNIFTLYFCMAILTFLAILRLPKIKGHQYRGIKVSPWLLLKNRKVIVLIAFNFIIQLTYGFYNSFFSVYYNELGANNTLLGLSMLISASSEVPFLLFADRILEKLGIRLTLLVSAFITSLRWGLLHLVTDVSAILAINALHGTSFIVFAFCTATFINKNVPKELRASGQTMNALLCMGIARAAGSAFGGMLSSSIGIKQVFLYTSLLGLASVVVFGIILHSLQKNKENKSFPNYSEESTEY